MTFLEFHIGRLISDRKTTASATFPINRLAVVFRSMSKKTTDLKLEKKCRFSDRFAVRNVIKRLNRKFQSVVRVVNFAQKTTDHFIGRSCGRTTY